MADYSPITITDSAYLTFETFAQYGSMWYDHYTVSVSTNGINWNTLWDAFYLNTYVNQYDEKVYLPLDDYIGQTIYIAWRAYNTLYDNFWYSWYIDDVRVEKRHHDTGDDGDDDDDDDDDGTGAPSCSVRVLILKLFKTLFVIYLHLQLTGSKQENII